MTALVAPYWERWQRMPAQVRASLLMVVATLGFSGMHAIIRYAATVGDMHPFEIAFFRNVFGLMVMLPFFWRNGLGIFRTRNLKLHALRGGIQIFAMLMFFTALSLSPLAKVSAMSFTAPLFATLGAILFLGERVRVRRILALLAGFAGAMMIIRPGVVSLDAGAVLVLCSSAIWAVAMLIIKVLSRTDSSVTITAYQGLFLTPFSLVAAVFFWQWPTFDQLLLFALMGLLGTVAHLATAEAFHLADTTSILPFDFTRLIWASVIGFILFAEVPELWTWIGGLTIFAAATYIAYREATLKAARAGDAGRGSG